MKRSSSPSGFWGIVVVASLGAAGAIGLAACDRERGAANEAPSSAATTAAKPTAAAADQPAAATPAPTATPVERPPTAEEQAARRAAQEAALAEAERAANGDVFVPKAVTLAPGWSWTDKHNSTTELDLAIGGMQQLSLRGEEDERKLEITEVEGGKITGLRVTYAHHLYHLDLNKDPGKVDRSLQGKTYLVSHKEHPPQFRTAEGKAPPSDEAKALLRRESLFGNADTIVQGMKGRRFPKDFEVELTPSDFVTPTGAFKISPVRVVMIYRGKEKGGARFEMRATMLGDNDSMKVRIESEDTMLLDPTGWRLVADQVGQLRTDGSVIGRGTTKVHREATAPAPPRRRTK